MKLKQIDFNAELIGQEGIVVKTAEGTEPKQLTYFNAAGTSYKIAGVVYNEVMHWRVNGKYYDTEECCRLDLIMYQEVKVLTVDEWYDQYVNDKYYRFPVRRLFNDLAAAIKAGEVEL